MINPVDYYDIRLSVRPLPNEGAFTRAVPRLRAYLQEKNLTRYQIVRQTLTIWAVPGSDRADIAGGLFAIAQECGAPVLLELIQRDQSRNVYGALV